MLLCIKDAAAQLLKALTGEGAGAAAEAKLHLKNEHYPTILANNYIM